MGYQVENNKVIIFGEDIRIFDYFEELSRIRVGLYDAIIYSEIVIAHGNQKNDFNVEELKEINAKLKEIVSKLEGAKYVKQNKKSF